MPGWSGRNAHGDHGTQGTRAVGLVLDARCESARTKELPGPDHGETPGWTPEMGMKQYVFLFRRIRILGHISRRSDNERSVFTRGKNCIGDRWFNWYRGDDSQRLCQFWGETAAARVLNKVRKYSLSQDDRFFYLFNRPEAPHLDKCWPPSKQEPGTRAGRLRQLCPRQEGKWVHHKVKHEISWRKGSGH